MTNPFSKEEKFFSICSPCYGSKYKELPRFFKHLEQQEFKNFETIVVFDGKNTRGEKVMRKMVKKYPDMDIKWYTIEHAGACAARNEAVRHSRGDYLAFPSPDCWLYPEALRIWANEFEDPSINRVWGMYDIEYENGQKGHQVGQAPVNQQGDIWYPAIKWSPHIDGTFPVRRSAFVEWDENCKSLNDWEWSVRLLKRTNFKGDDHKYIHHAFFVAQAPIKGGLSDDSYNNYKERKDYIQKKNGIETSDICVVSHGAPHHAFHVTEKLGAEFMRMPSYRPHEYKLVYLLGFYTKEDPKMPYVTKSHMDTFERNNGKSVVHWIGSDILQLRWNCSFEKIKALKNFFKREKIIHLCEAKWTQDELKEVGIDAKIVPIPPAKLYEPMPLPKKFTVGIYTPNSDLYKPELMQEVIRSLPDVHFYLFGDNENKGAKGKNWEQLGWIDLDEWMPKFSCNLRVTVHDGLPLTPLQFLTAGRNVVTDLPLKGAITVKKERDAVVKGIRQAQKNPLDSKVSKYWLKELDTKRYIKRIRGLI